MSTLFYVSFALLWAIVVFQGLLLLGLGRLVFRETDAADAPEIDTASLLTKPLPEFRARDIGGNDVSSDQFGGHIAALLFVSPSCSSCTLTLHEMAALRQKTDDHVVVVSRGTEDETVAMAQSHDLSVPVVVDEWGELVKLFGISAFPSAVLINEKSEVQSIGHPLRNEEQDGRRARDRRKAKRARSPKQTEYSTGAVRL